MRLPRSDTARGHSGRPARHRAPFSLPILHPDGMEAGIKAHFRCAVLLMRQRQNRSPHGPQALRPRRSWAPPSTALRGRQTTAGDRKHTACRPTWRKFPGPVPLTYFILNSTCMRSGPPKRMPRRDRACKRPLRK